MRVLGSWSRDAAASTRARTRAARAARQRRRRRGARRRGERGEGATRATRARRGGKDCESAKEGGDPGCARKAAAIAPASRPWRRIAGAWRTTSTVSARGEGAPLAVHGDRAGLTCRSPCRRGRGLLLQPRAPHEAAPDPHGAQPHPQLRPLQEDGHLACSRRACLHAAAARLQRPHRATFQEITQFTRTTTSTSCAPSRRRRRAVPAAGAISSTCWTTPDL